MNLNNALSGICGQRITCEDTTSVQVAEQHRLRRNESRDANATTSNSHSPDVSVSNNTIIIIIIIIIIISLLKVIKGDFNTILLPVVNMLVKLLLAEV